ncbi:peptidoglycan-binding domain-containing protein [Janibacter sp. LM]|uniref:peptidoglycan-binding domain-containing protein n=1 Tax=Janibacter sp. LM TaxID=3144845 RepID=UPI0031F689A9
MARILLISANLTGLAYTRTKAALEGLGHTVTGSAETMSEMTAAWGSGKDLIVTAGVTFDRFATPLDSTTFVIDKWTSGTPILLGHGVGSVGTPERTAWARTGLGRETSLAGSTGTTSRMDSVTTAHPIVGSYSGNVTVLTAAQEGSHAVAATGAVPGTILGRWGDRTYLYMGAVEVGDPLDTDRIHAHATAPARAVYCGWLYGGDADYTIDGKAILGQAVQWLAPAGPPPGPTGTAATAHAWAGSSVGTSPRQGTSTIAHTWTPSSSGTAPRQATAAAAHAWAPTAAGAVPVADPEGTATTGHTWVPAAVGDDTEPTYGTAATAWTVTPTATGTNGDAVGGTAGTGHAWLPEADGQTAGERQLQGWDLDHSQQVVLDVTGPDDITTGPLDVERVVVDPPPTIKLRRITRHSPQNGPGDFTVNPDGSVHSRGLWDITDGDVGSLRVWVNGKDVTWFRGVPTLPGNAVASEPFGWESLTLTFPQISAFEEPGVGDLYWLKPDHQVEVYLIAPDKTRVLELFQGHLVNDAARITDSETATTWECAGDMATASYALHRAPITLEPTDIGTLIARALSGVISRRYGTVQSVTTGIDSLVRGDGDDYVTEYVSELLAHAWTSDGRQWTVARTRTPRVYGIELKDITTRHWTITPGTPGVTVRLDADQASRTDAIMGRGVGPDGYAWSGRHWPALLNYDPPDFPNASAGDVLMPGATDASTGTGRGVSTWQERARDLGYAVTVDGVIGAGDVAVIRAIQARMGLLVDGIIGPQTWTGTWEVGVDAAALQSIRLPIAYRPIVEPNLYSAVGAVTGKNPAYDRYVIRRERAVDYGAHITKALGTLSARREVAQSQDVGWFGDVTLDVDPREGSRWLIEEGQNIVVKGWRGADQLCHIAKVTRDLLTGRVTLAVDTKARDAMTLASLRRRDREAQIDPARRPGNVNRKSRQSQDLRVAFEGDSPAGRIYRRALYRGLWSVFPVPVSEAGSIVRLDASTDSPRSEFALGFFARPIQPSHLLRLVGNPSADSEAWRRRLPQLEDAGLIEAWGAGESMAGHWPTQDGPTTGRLIDTGGWSFHSDMGGWVWVAAWAPVSCWISGRVYPAPLDG